jgi:hypothetical protein
MYNSHVNMHKLNNIKKIFLAGSLWLTPIILTTQGGRDQEDHSSKPALGK